MSEHIRPQDIMSSSRDAWKLFRIIAEFVEGFETMSSIGPSISIFGSARLPKTSPYFHLAQDVAHKIAKKGFSVITGAGPGLMEAANKGAQEAKGTSCGLIIDVPYETEPNPYIDPKLRLRFRYFFVRKVMFARYAQGFVFLPGGLGTLDELFEVLTLIQTKKTVPIPIYLMGTSYWKGLIQWLSESALHHKCISKEDLDLFIVTDNADEVADGLEQAYKDRMKLISESK
jgi:uncharacterized protein (TIGR00730 family)